MHTVIILINIVVFIICLSSLGKLTEYVEEPVIAGFLNAFGLFLLKSQVSYHYFFLHLLPLLRFPLFHIVFNFRCLFNVLILRLNLILVSIVTLVFEFFITFINHFLLLSVSPLILVCELCSYINVHACTHVVESISSIPLYYHD
jgi:MFS superfamily sulfate permease-like transporter